jgi:hypothetical protein
MVVGEIQSDAGITNKHDEAFKASRKAAVADLICGGM